MAENQTAKISILTYHSLDESGSVISTREQTFRAQMKHLSAAGYKVISLDMLKKYVQEGKTIRPKTIILTFDDGFQNFYEKAFPVLTEYNFPATVFLVADYCGKLNDWRGNLPGLPPSRLMGWSEIKELSKLGIEFGAHSLTHADLTAISNEAARREIVYSKNAIEERLGREVKTFAYPYGRFNDSVKTIVKENYELACSTNLGKVEPDDDLLVLRRLDSYYLSNERLFRSISSSQFDWYMGFRQVLRDVKSALFDKLN